MNKFDLFLIIITFLLIALGVFFIIEIRSDNAECIKEPFVYAVKSLESQTSKNVVCSCSDGIGTIYFDRNGLTTYIP